MSEVELVSVVIFAVMVIAAAVLVVSSLDLTARPTPSLARVRLTRRKDGVPPVGTSALRALRGASARQGGQILEYLGKLAQEFEPIATDEEIATPRGAVSIPMAIAVRGEVRVLYPVEPPLSAERIDEALRRVALIRRHRFPEARIAFLSERALPLELALAASPDNTLGRLVAQSVLHVTELREGRDDATVFRQVFKECADVELGYGVDDLTKVDELLQQAEPLAGPITPGLRRIGNLLGRYLEWVLAGLFPEKLRCGDGRVALAMDGGELELDTSNLALEAIYSAGRMPLAGLVRDLQGLAADPFFVPKEVSPAILQRFPTPAELVRYRRPIPVEEALAELKARRLEALALESDQEEIASLYRCPCGKSELVIGPLAAGSPACRSHGELEARLMQALQEAATREGPRCRDCQRRLSVRELALISAAHPMLDRGVDLWVTLDRLPSGKFWWHLSRLRRAGDITHYSTVLAPSTFRRAFGRFFSVKEAWSILFQKVGSTLREEKLRAEPGLVLHAAPEGLATAPRAVVRSGFFSPKLSVPLPREAPSSPPWDESFLANERLLGSLGIYARPPLAWAEASCGPYRRMFERHARSLGARIERKGLACHVHAKGGGVAYRDLSQAIIRACLEGSDYLSSARALAVEAVSEAERVREYLDRVRESLGPCRLDYLPVTGVLEVSPDGGGVPSQVPLKSLLAKTNLSDGSFERFLKMAVSSSDLGVGIDVCGCGAPAFVAKKLKPRDWPAVGDAAGLDLVRRIDGGANVIFTRDCREHSHYLSGGELRRAGIALDELERRARRDLGENSFTLTFRALRVDAHVFFAVAGFNAASAILSGELCRGLLDAAGIELEAPKVRFHVTTTGSLVLGEPEAPTAAFREAAKVAESMLRDMGEAFERVSHEGVLHLAERGAGEFRISR